MEIINELKMQSFRNAVKLFRDACLLAVNDRNETAYAVAILAYEEIGKAAIADRQLDCFCLNPGSEAYARETLLELLKRHRVKQQWAASDSGAENLEITEGLDLKKQQAIYVDYDGKKVTLPSVSKEKLKLFIGEVFRALNGVGEMPYYGIAGVSSDKAEWQAQKDIESVKEVYKSVIGL